MLGDARSHQGPAGAPGAAWVRRGLAGHIHLERAPNASELLFVSDGLGRADGPMGGHRFGRTRVGRRTGFSHYLPSRPNSESSWTGEEFL